LWAVSLNPLEFEPDRRGNRSATEGLSRLLAENPSMIRIEIQLDLTFAIRRLFQA